MERHRPSRERSFPRVAIPRADGSRAVEVVLLAQLDPGAGDALAATTGIRQRHHPAFHDALDEPSARLSAPDVAGNDPAALFTFAVGSGGHPFHRHAAPRLFTAISGSGGARLRFVPAGPSTDDAGDFLDALRHVDVPADCLFTVRMAANTWHRFQPLHGDGRHPALFAVSCHPDEAAGHLAPATREDVLAGTATLATLTELLPAHLQAALHRHEHAGLPVATTTLGFAHALHGSWCRGLCAHLRRHAGRLRRAMTKHCHPRGFVAADTPRPEPMRNLPSDSLLHAQLADHHHQDSVRLRIGTNQLAGSSPEQLLARLLDAFVEQPASTVSGLMQLRNRLVAPLGLRTSPLGCPVSSLLSDAPGRRFANRFPVLDCASGPRTAQVLLGADDRHLAFRSCVRVDVEHGVATFTLSTRVRCRNAFGHAYMALINPLHRHYIAPKMLATATDCLLLDALHPVPAGT